MFLVKTDISGKDRIELNIESVSNARSGVCRLTEAEKGSYSPSNSILNLTSTWGPPSCSVQCKSIAGLNYFAHRCVVSTFVRWLFHVKRGIRTTLYNSVIILTSNVHDAAARTAYRYWLQGHCSRTRSTACLQALYQHGNSDLAARPLLPDK
eukprot:6193806-Pleurochrysis_carterae.AAC.1